MTQQDSEALAAASIDESFDVVISGAGLAGGTLAIRLANSGVKVALVDPGVFPRDKLCGEFLSPECWGVFDRLGLADEIGRLRYHSVRRARITTPRGRVLEAELVGKDGLPGIALSRSALDDLIVKTARASGVDVREQTRVTGPLVRDGRVMGVVARSASGRSTEIRAAITIAADGRHSALTQQTGTVRARSRFRPRHFGLKRHLLVPEENSEPSGTVGLHLVAGGYVGTCLVESGLTNLCGLLPESILRRHRGRLDELADEQFAKNPTLHKLWNAGESQGPWKTVSGVRVEARAPRLPGIFYAGDCQGTVDPLGGQGMTMALLGVEVLAPFVTHALSSGLAGPDIQRAYGAAWHRRFDHRVNMCRLFHHVLVNPWIIDAASTFKTLAPALLAFGYDQTRDSEKALGGSF